MSKRLGGKSIIASFGALSSSLPEASSNPAQSTDEAPVHRPLARVGAGVIGATQRSLAEIREERDRLQALVAKGGSQELDPTLIDPSPFPDRLPDDSDEAFEALKTLIRDEGQKVPIQVRVNPRAPDRFQVVYGHRRWRAARDLGIAVKAIVVDLTDSELVVAQGIENAVRQDLSWIERSLFAWRMDQQGIKPRDIKAALAVDDAELTRLRQVPRVLPADVIEGIGRAPKVGRPRWTALASEVERNPDALERVRKTLSADKAASSDLRFVMALSAASGSRATVKRTDEVKLRNASGAVLGTAVFKGGSVRLKLAKEDGEAFAEFLRGELAALVERFDARKGGS
jgi:ParB family chromosome partitioning protein